MINTYNLSTCSRGYRMQYSPMNITLIKRPTVKALLDREKVYEQTLKSRVVRLLSDSRLSDRIPACAELCITLLDNPEIQDLNREYRNQDKTTDVLSFSMLEGESFDLPDGLPVPLGDIMISVEVALLQSTRGALPRLHSRLKSEHWGLAEELSFLILHGVLHLLGYDHESESDAEQMESLEAELLKVVLPKICH